MQELQNKIQGLLDQLVADKEERGVQVAVYLGEELVVDASAGVADPATGQLVNGSTLFPAFSTTKGIAATLLHLLVERGKVDYDTRIAEVWPEFAAHGKEATTVRHALNHTAGVPNLPMGIGHTELCDWETMCAAMADLVPVSPPGAVYAYHAITYSWTVGEVVHRVDGRSFSQLLHDEICAPLGLTNDLFVGIPEEAEARVATLEDPKFDRSTLPDASTPLPIPRLMQPLHEWMNRTDARRACLPGCNGIMNARAIARHYAALLPGGVDGIELLPPERIRQALEPQRCLGAKPGEEPLAHQLGYARSQNFPGTEFGHGGYGGSVALANLDHRLAVGFTRNRFVSETSWAQIADALRKALDI